MKDSITHLNGLRVQDLLMKTFSTALFFLVLFLAISGYLGTTDYFKDTNRSDSFIIFNNFSKIIMTIGLVFVLISKYFMIHTFRNSNYNNTNIEKKIHSFLAFFKQITLPNIGYYFVIFLFSGTLFYFSLDIIAMMANEAALIPEVSYDFKKLENFNQIIETTNIINVLSVIFFLYFIFTKPEKRISRSFLFGLFVLPTIVNMIFGSNINSFFAPKNLSNSTFLNEISQFYSNGMIFIFAFLCIVSFIILLHVYLGFSSGLYKMDLKSLSTYTGTLSFGYLTNFLVIIVFGYLVCYSPNVKLMTDNDSVTSISIKGKDFTFRNSVLVAEGNNRQMEDFIESYVGLSMHNFDENLKYMLTEYNGDKTKIIEFTAKLLLENQKKMIKHQDDAMKLLTTEGIPVNDSMRLFIPLIIQDNAPLFKVEDALNAMTEHKYQEAIDLYIEKNLNNTIEHHSKYNGDVVENNYGHPTVALLVKFILDNDLAKLDYNLIKDEKLKLKTLDFMTNPDNQDLVYYRAKHVEKDMISEWYHLMDID